MGNAITTAGNNNLLGILGLQDALMHMFPDFHTDVAKHLAVQSVVMPGKSRNDISTNLILKIVKLHIVQILTNEF